MTSKKYIKRKIKNKREVYIPSRKTRIGEEYFKNMFITNSTNEKILNITKRIKTNTGVNIIDNLIETLKVDSYNYILRTDIKSFFKNINASKLSEEILPKLLPEEAVKFADEIFLDDQFKTGSSLSIIFAEMYLSEALAFMNDIKHYRYIDDIIVLTKTKEEAEEIQHKLEEALSTIDLTLNRDKTKILEKTDMENEFIGFNFYYYKPKDVVYVNVRRKTLNRIEKKYKEYYKDVIKAHFNDRKIDVIIADMNKNTAMLCNYYLQYPIILKRDFYFVNKLIRKIADEIGFTNEITSTLEKINIRTKRRRNKKGKKGINKKTKQFIRTINCLVNSMNFYEGYTNHIYLIEGQKILNNN